MLQGQYLYNKMCRPEQIVSSLQSCDHRVRVEDWTSTSTWQRKYLLLLSHKRSLQMKTLSNKEYYLFLRKIRLTFCLHLQLSQNYCLRLEMLLLEMHPEVKEPFLFQSQTTSFHNLQCQSSRQLTIWLARHQESIFRSTMTSFKFSGVAFTVEGKSTSVLGGAKYMCSDIIQIIIPKKSCRKFKRS